MRVKKASFTLLEIMVALAVIGIVAGALGWQVKKMVDVARFNNSVKRVGEEITRLQMLAMLYQSDLTVDLTSDALISRTDEPTVKGNTLSLKGVTTPKKIHLDIYADGRIEPSQVIEFTGAGQKLFLDLSTPLQIKIGKQYPKVIPIPIPKRPDADHKPRV